MQKRQYNDDYQKQLFDYAQYLVNESLRKKGKYIEDRPRLYVIYARKSTKGKDRQERSIPDQIKDCQKLASTLKIQPLHIFREEESAKTAGKRDVFYEMLDWIKTGKCNSIIAYHPDRLARNMKDAGEVIDLLDRGVIVDLKFAQYTFVNDPNGVMTLGIQFVMAKQYSDNLSAVSQRGSFNIAREGKAPTNKPKYGYKLNKQRYFRPDGHNFELLKEAFRMGLDKWPQEEIAEYLNKGSFTFQGRKTAMTKQKVSSIFQDTFYAGLYVYSSEIITLKEVDPLFQPLITPLEFLQLRKTLNDKYNFRRSARLKTILFNKMVYCGYCNHLMSPGKPRSSGKSQNRYLNLRCSRKDCPSRFDKKISRGLRGKIIFDYILEVLSSGFTIDKTAYEAYVKEAKQVLSYNRKKLVNQLKGIGRQISETDKTIETKTLALAKAQGALIDKLNQEIKQLSDDLDNLKHIQTKIQEDIITIDHNLESKLMSYENFLNFFDNLANTIKSSDNQYLVDKIIRMIFLNFTIKDKKVLSHQLNPNFEKYVKIPSVQDGRGGENRTPAARTPCAHLTTRLLPELLKSL